MTDLERFLLMKKESKKLRAAMDSCKNLRNVVEELCGYSIFLMKEGKGEAAIAVTQCLEAIVPAMLSLEKALYK